MLFESVATNRGNADYLFFPLAFLWRHHIELALKNIIAKGRELEGDACEYPTGHRLSVLWVEAKPHIVKCGDPDAPELGNVEANIEEFERIDPAADGFRYPHSRDRKSASLQDPPASASLLVLHEAMVALSNFFDGVDTEMSVRLDALSDMAAANAVRDYY
jgi:hypothetical protein